MRTATWLTNLEFDWESPLWRHWLKELADGHTVIRYDERGCGLSDRDVEDVSLEGRVADLEAVIDAAGLERVALLGMSQGGAVAVAFAARHPERVSHLVLFATFARGRLMRDTSPSDREQAQLMTSLIRMGWGQGLPAFRRLFTTLFIPGATAEQMEWFDELQRVTTDPETAVRIRDARNEDEVTEEATRVACPALVMHPRDDALVPFAEGRRLATLIPGARFVAALSAVGATLAGSGVASAAMVVQKPGTGTRVVASQPTIVAQYIDPNKVGSAGIPGYDNAMCESLANDHNKAESAGIQAVKDGDASAAQANIDNADGIQSELEQNCVVID